MASKSDNSEDYQSLGSQNIYFTGSLTITAFERELAKSFNDTRQSSTINFDITSLEWIGYLPAKLLFAWVAFLAKSDSKTVSITLPRRENLSHQMKKVLLEYGILAELAALGVNVPYSSSPDPSIGVPLTIVQSEESLWNHLKVTAKDLLSSPAFPRTASSLMMDE
jgi:hypothetical protein